MADMLLDTQYYNVNDPRLMTIPAGRSGRAQRENCPRYRRRDLKAPMTLLTADAHVRGGISGTGGAGYVINHNTDNTLATLRFKLRM